MSFLNSVVNIGKSALEKLQGNSDPNVVKTVGASEFGQVPTQDREDCLLLQGPRNVKVKKEQVQIYDIIVQSDRHHHIYFSLCRCNSKEEAREKFDLYKNTIPTLMCVNPDLCQLVPLQQICDVLRQNPSLTVAHLAVELDFKNVLPNPIVEPMLNAQDAHGVTPIMMAVKKNNIAVVKFLVGKGVDFTTVDAKQNNVFHYAAASSKEIIAVFGDQDKLLTQCNDDGLTPLHIACQEDMPDCVQALICAGADANVTGTLDDMEAQETSKSVKGVFEMFPKQIHTQDMKHGGTPLHWSKSKDIVRVLVDSGCHIDAKNFRGDTALHAMIRHGRLDCAVAMISYGANLSLKDANGNTSLHLAVETGHDTIVRALIVFNADCSLVNDKEETPWDIALKKATTDTSIMDTFQSKDRKAVLYSMYAVGAFGSSEMPDGVRLDKKQNKLSPVHKRTRILFDEVLANAAKNAKSSSKEKKGSRLLSLDGGGIKGLALTRMLLSMEDAWETPVIHCFDWIAGTSTGAILALALASGKSALECQHLYFQLKDKVFVGTRPYDTKPLEELLQQTFGLAKMRDIEAPKLVITATMADRSPPDLKLFRNYKSPQEALGVSDYDHPDLAATPTHQQPETLVWKAARASGAAPSFFRAEGNYVDGGIVSNNPSLDLLSEIAEYNLAQRATGNDSELVEPSVLLSLGTGVPPVKKTTVVDIFRPDSATDTLKLFMNWDGMGKLMLDSVLDADGPCVDRCRAWCMSTNTAYYRFSPLLVADVELDEKDEKILVDLMWNAMVIVHNRKDDVARLKKLLVGDTDANKMDTGN